MHAAIQNDIRQCAYAAGAYRTKPVGGLRQAGRQAGRDVWMVVARAMVRDIPQIPEEQAFQDILFCFITG